MGMATESGSGYKDEPEPTRAGPDPRRVPRRLRHAPPCAARRGASEAEADTHAMDGVEAITRSVPGMGLMLGPRRKGPPARPTARRDAAVPPEEARPCSDARRPQLARRAVPSEQSQNRSAVAIGGAVHYDPAYGREAEPALRAKRRKRPRQRPGTPRLRQFPGLDPTTCMSERLSEGLLALLGRLQEDSKWWRAQIHREDRPGREATIEPRHRPRGHRWTCSYCVVCDDAGRSAGC